MKRAAIYIRVSTQEQAQEGQEGFRGFRESGEGDFHRLQGRHGSLKAEDGLSQAGEGKGIPQREAVRDDRRGMDGAQDFRRVAGDEKESAPRLESGPAGVRGKDEQIPKVLLISAGDRGQRTPSGIQGSQDGGQE